LSSAKPSPEKGKGQTQLHTQKTCRDEYSFQLEREKDEKKTPISHKREKKKGMVAEQIL